MELKTDVLIIGGGGAGLRAAIAAADCGAEVLVVSKRKIGKAGATAYPIAEMAGYNAADIYLPGDAEHHYQDIITAGQGMAIPKLAAVVAANAPGTLEQLEKWGVSFEYTNGAYYIFKSCFANNPRTHVIKGHGEPIIKAMQMQIARRSNIKILDDVTILGLICAVDQVVGAYASKGGDIFAIRAKATVMATGGNGQAFEKNMNPADVSGDGYAMAYDVGAELLNMEFMQIGIGFSWPVTNIFNGYIWQGLPKLYDNTGCNIFDGVLPHGVSEQDVMHEHRKHFPFSSSDISQYLEIAVHRATHNKRGTAHHGISIDLSHMTDAYVNQLRDDCGIHHMWPIARDYMKERGVDLLNTQAEVAVYAHAINGGIKIDEDASSTVSGLFAAGECAGGPHGADRLGGNMMVTCQVFGEIAGRKAAEYAMLHQKQPEENCAERLEQLQAVMHKKLNLAALKKKITQSAQASLLVDRSETGLRECEALVDEVKKEIETSSTAQVGNPANVSFYNMLTTLKIMAKCAGERKESRGSHHRKDYSSKSENLGNPIIIKKM